MGPYDVVIAGAGPAGLALAGALSGSPLSVLLLDPRSPRPVAERPIALSHGSRLLLERLAAWRGLRGSPIETIHVSQRHGFGRTVIRAADHDIPALGYVVAYSELAASLATQTHTGTAPYTVGETAGGGSHLVLTLASADGDPEQKNIRIESRLLVVADGNTGLHGADAQVHHYGQVAIVTTASSAVARPGHAWERFTPQGPLALLPYCRAAAGTAREGRHYAVIWSVAAETAPSLLESGDAQFSRALSDAFGTRLGELRVTSARHAFPLALRISGRSRSGRTVMIGNAAQTLHPVAGQGLNVGLRDAWELAELLRDSTQQDIGGDAFLERFAARRRLDRLAGVRFTDALVNLFSTSSGALGAFRGAGLAALDMLPPARQFLARRMMFGSRAMP